MKTYVGKIEKLEPNQIFVFGSNTEGKHGAGAALFAVQHCGAKYFQAAGRQGQSYAIITKDLTKRLHPSVSPRDIIQQIQTLYEYARQNADLEFLVAYSANGRNLNYYTSQQMANMFSDAGPIPENIVFEEGFSKLL